MPYDTAFYAPALWARVRDDYLAGESADAVCARHGVSRSQLFAQARAGGWRRSDQACATPVNEADPDDEAPAPPTSALAGEALRLGARAVARGRLHEAQGWVALAARLRALAKDEHDGWRRFLATDDDGAGFEAGAAPDADLSPPAAQAAQPPLGAMDIVEAVGRLAEEGEALARRRDAGEDITAPARALEARVTELEARSAALAPWTQPRAPAPAARRQAGGPDGPAGLPPGAGVSSAAVAAALGWEPQLRGEAWSGAG